MKWDFKNMDTPPPGLHGPREPIKITMPSSYRMTKPPVVFRHGTHDTLACNACHPARVNKLITDIDFVTTCPHTMCMGCHQQMVDEKLASGPVDCQGCHIPGGE